MVRAPRARRDGCRRSGAASPPTWHALAADAVLSRAAPPRAGHDGPRQNAPQRGTAEGEPLVLLQQFGEVGVVGARVARGGEARNGSRPGLGDGVVGPAAAVAVGERPRATLPGGGEQPPGVAFAEVHQRRRLAALDLPAMTLLRTWSRACSCWCNVTSFMEGQNR